MTLKLTLHSNRQPLIENTIILSTMIGYSSTPAVVCVLLLLAKVCALNAFFFSLDCTRLSPVLRENCQCEPQDYSIICEDASNINGHLPPIPFGTVTLEIHNANLTSMSRVVLPRTLARLVIRNSSLMTPPPELPIALEHVDLSYNALTDLEKVPWLPNLRSLNADHNHITTMTPRWSPSVERISINNNQLEKLPDLLNTNIKVITAHENRISYIDRLPASLEELNLPWNRMTSLRFLLAEQDVHGGSIHSRLKVLDFYGNPEFDLNSRDADLKELHYFSPSLRELRVGQTATSKFPAWLCSVFPNVEHLSFFNGQLHEIQHEDFTAICNNTVTIELQGNALSRGVDSPFVAAMFPNLRYLTLHNTSINCDCALIAYIVTEKIEVDFWGARATCARPPRWRGFLLQRDTLPADCKATPAEDTTTRINITVIKTRGEELPDVNHAMQSHGELIILMQHAL